MLALKLILVNKYGKKQSNLSYFLRCLPLFFAFIIDGFILGSNLESYTTTFGVLLALVLSIDNIFIGLDLGEKQKKLKIDKIIGYISIFLLVFAVPIGCFIGHNVNQYLKYSPWFYFLIAIGILSLIWDLFQEQIPNLYKQKMNQTNVIFNILGFYVGFIGILLAEWYVH